MSKNFEEKIHCIIPFYLIFFIYILIWIGQKKWDGIRKKRDRTLKEIKLKFLFEELIKLRKPIYNYYIGTTRKNDQKCSVKTPSEKIVETPSNKSIRNMMALAKKNITFDGCKRRQDNMSGRVESKMFRSQFDEIPENETMGTESGGTPGTAYVVIPKTPEIAFVGTPENDYDKTPGTVLGNSPTTLQYRRLFRNLELPFIRNVVENLNTVSILSGPDENAENLGPSHVNPRPFRRSARRSTRDESNTVNEEPSSSGTASGGNNSLSSPGRISRPSQERPEDIILYESNNSHEVIQMKEDVVSGDVYITRTPYSNIQLSAETEEEAYIDEAKRIYQDRIQTAIYLKPNFMNVAFLRQLEIPANDPQRYPLNSQSVKRKNIDPQRYPLNSQSVKRKNIFYKTPLYDVLMEEMNEDDYVSDDDSNTGVSKQNCVLRGFNLTDNFLFQRPNFEEVKKLFNRTHMRQDNKDNSESALVTASDGAQIIAPVGAPVTAPLVEPLEASKSAPVVETVGAPVDTQVGESHAASAAPINAAGVATTVRR